MNKNALIIYHNIDLDGKGSAYIAWKGLKRNKYINDIDFLPYNYEGHYYLKSLTKSKIYDFIVCVDVSIPLETILFLKNNNENIKITVIDHHNLDNKYISGLNSIDNVRLIHDKSLAAIQLTWKFYNRKSKIPKWVNLLGDYDRWYNENKNYWNKQVMPFQMFMRAQDIEIPININIFDDFIKWTSWDYRRAYKTGNLIWDYDKEIRRDIIENFVYKRKWEGLRAIVCNSSLRGSQLFDCIYNENDYDIMIVYNYDGYEYIYSLYSTKDNIDCSEIAKKYGGGGHKGAAGFRSKFNVIDKLNLIDYLKWRFFKE